MKFKTFSWPQREATTANQCQSSKVCTVSYWPTAVVVATHEHFPASTADGAVGLITVVIVLVGTLQERVLPGNTEQSQEEAYRECAFLICSRSSNVKIWEFSQFYNNINWIYLSLVCWSNIKQSEEVTSCSGKFCWTFFIILSYFIDKASDLLFKK